MGSMEMESETNFKSNAEARFDDVSGGGGGGDGKFQKFMLYETRSVQRSDLGAACLFERELVFFMSDFCFVWFEFGKKVADF